MCVWYVQYVQNVCAFSAWVCVCINRAVVMGGGEGGGSGDAC